MKTLYYYPLDAFGRIIRVYLNERSIEYQEVEDYPWDRKYRFSENHMFSDLPTLVENSNTILEGCYSIVEHIEQMRRSDLLSGNSLKEKEEICRISSLFNINFFADVTNNIVFERVIKRHLDRSSPDSASIRKGNNNIKKYFNYISWLINRRSWLAGKNFSFADISAAAQISCIDYMGSIEWESYPEVKDWYVRIKSRPSFRKILKDRIIDINPPSFYSDLDF